MIDRDDLDRFDPSDHWLLTQQDELMQTTEAYAGPLLSRAAVRAMPDGDLAAFMRDLRAAVLLPLSETFISGMLTVLAFAEYVHDRQRRRLRRRTMYTDRFEDADLVGEVEAAGVTLKKQGREYTGLCPFHSDRRPSLYVNGEKRTWLCRACGAGGGVHHWRQAIGGVA